MIGLSFEMSVVDAQVQGRTERYVASREWVRPRVPAKAAGRRGTRRAWKRRHPPYWRVLYRYREPDNVLVISGSARGLFGVSMPDLWIVTPKQKAAIMQMAADLGREVPL